MYCSSVKVARILRIVDIPYAYNYFAVPAGYDEYAPPHIGFSLQVVMALDTEQEHMPPPLKNNSKINVNVNSNVSNNNKNDTNNSNNDKLGTAQRGTA